MSETVGDPARDEQLDSLATRGVDVFVRFTRRGVRFGLWVLAFVVVGCVSGFALGLAALSGTARTIWIVVGGVFLVVGVGSAARAVFRLWVIGRTSEPLVKEVRSLIGADPQAERVVIETVETSERSSSTALAISSGRFGQWQSIDGSRRSLGDVTAIALALASLASFPRLVGLALLVTFVFMGLGFVFAIAIFV